MQLYANNSANIARIMMKFGLGLSIVVKQNSVKFGTYLSRENQKFQHGNNKFAICN